MNIVHTNAFAFTLLAYRKIKIDFDSRRFVNNVIATHNTWIDDWILPAAEFILRFFFLCSDFVCLSLWKCHWISHSLCESKIIRRVVRFYCCWFDICECVCMCGLCARVSRSNDKSLLTVYLIVNNHQQQQSKCHHELSLFFIQNFLVHFVFWINSLSPVYGVIADG